MISFVIPAHNEEALIGQTIAAVHASARAHQETYEIIVANDASTDETRAIALSKGARVIDVNNRQIAATRNAGAKVSTGKFLFFVDADTLATTRALKAALRALRGGAVGGGCCVHIEGELPFYGRVIECVAQAFAPLIGLAGGCFFYCTRKAFFRAGGFNESLFAAEEVDMAQRLRRLGKFVVKHERVITSGRKLRAYSAWAMLRLAVRLALAGSGSLKKREGLEFWYGPR